MQGMFAKHLVPILNCPEVAKYLTIKVIFEFGSLGSTLGCKVVHPRVKEVDGRQSVAVLPAKICWYCW